SGCDGYAIAVDDDPDALAAALLREAASKRGGLGADAREAAVGSGLAVDPERAAGHQMIRRSARKSTTSRAASSAGARTTRVAARGGGASAPSTAVVAASPPTGVSIPATSPSVFVSI